MRALAFALALVPQGVWALSCMQPDIARTFRTVAEATETYSILHGRLEFVPVGRDVREAGEGFDERALPPVTGTFSGSYLADAGWVTGYETPLQIAFTCMGPWCGDLTPDTTGIFFVAHRSDGLWLEVTACPAFALLRPSAADIETVERCVMAGGC